MHKRVAPDTVTRRALRTGPPPMAAAGAGWTAQPRLCPSASVRQKDNDGRHCRRGAPRTRTGRGTYSRSDQSSLASPARWFYLGAISGSARIAEEFIIDVKVIDFEALGMEAVWRIEVRDFPAFVVIDDAGISSPAPQLAANPLDTNYPTLTGQRVSHSPCRIGDRQTRQVPVVVTTWR